MPERKSAERIRGPEELFLIVGLIMLASEIWKQISLAAVLHYGTDQLAFLPFQLCSIPMYVCLILGIFPGSRVEKHLLTFLKDFSVLAGILAFADTSGFREYGYLPLIIHSYCWHILMIAIGIYAGILLMRRHGTPFRFREWCGALLIYLLCCGAAELLNLGLYRYGPINMFYISPKYWMQQIVFRNWIPILGNNGTILAYIAATAAGSLLVHAAWAWAELLRGRR